MDWHPQWKRLFFAPLFGTPNILRPFSWKVLGLSAVLVSCSSSDCRDCLEGSSGGSTQLGSGGLGNPQGSSGGVDGGGGSGASPGSGGETAPDSGGRASGGAATSGGAENGVGGNVASGGGTSGSGGTGTAPSWPDPDCAAPVELGVELVGRYDGCDPDGVRMAWSGTGFKARFVGTGLSFSQRGGPVQYTVVVDGQPKDDLLTTSATSTYEIASGLENGDHLVEVYRRGEASFGAVTLLGVEVQGGQLFTADAPASRRIELFGDSITCGYGDEGTSATCSFSADTENHYLSYGAVLGRKFDAEVSTVAWSGKGVVVNYGGDMSTTLPQMVDRAIPSEATSVWDYSLASPPAVAIVNLGTNDFSTDSDPSVDEFTTTYEGLLRVIRARYPDALILCTVGPMLSGTDLDKARQGIQDAVQTLADEGDDAVVAHAMQTQNPNPGCDYHPSIATHQAMADELAGVISSRLGW